MWTITMIDDVIKMVGKQIYITKNMQKRVTKLDSLIVIFYCMFIGSCFTTSPNKSYLAEKSLKKCSDSEDDKKDCVKSGCFDLTQKNIYKDSYRTPTRIIEKTYDLNFKCNEDVLDM